MENRLGQKKEKKRAHLYGETNKPLAGVDLVS